MSDSIVIIGRETVLGNKLIEKIDVDNKTLVTITNKDDEFDNMIKWNRTSRISAKTSIRELKRKYGIPSEIYIVFGKKYENDDILSNTTFIEDVIDNELKGLFYILQELLMITQNSNNVSFYFISDEIFDKSHPYSSACAAAFKVYAEAIIYNNENHFMLGFDKDGGDDEKFLSFVTKTISVHSNKKNNIWNTFPRGGRLFG